MEVKAEEEDPYKECRVVVKFAPLVVRAPRECHCASAKFSTCSVFVMCCR